MLLNGPKAKCRCKREREREVISRGAKIKDLKKKSPFSLTVEEDENQKTVKKTWPLAKP